MSLQSSLSAEFHSQTAAVARAAFPQGNASMRLKDALGTVFTDARFTAFGLLPWSPGRGTLAAVSRHRAAISPRTSRIAARPRQLVAASTGNTSWASIASPRPCVPRETPSRIPGGGVPAPRRPGACVTSNPLTICTSRWARGGSSCSCRTGRPRRTHFCRPCSRPTP